MACWTLSLNLLRWVRCVECKQYNLKFVFSTRVLVLCAFRVVLCCVVLCGVVWLCGCVVGQQSAYCSVSVWTTLV